MSIFGNIKSGTAFNLSLRIAQEGISKDTFVRNKSLLKLRL
jgi:hypothetical protein